jgi:hypothetical protein
LVASPRSNADNGEGQTSEDHQSAENERGLDLDRHLNRSGFPEFACAATRSRDAPLGISRAPSTTSGKCRLRQSQPRSCGHLIWAGQHDRGRLAIAGSSLRSSRRNALEPSHWWRGLPPSSTQALAGGPGRLIPESISSFFTRRRSALVSIRLRPHRSRDESIAKSRSRARFGESAAENATKTVKNRVAYADRRGER